MSALQAPKPFPTDGHRTLVYVIFDRRGELDDYVVHTLASLRPHFAHILAVVNGSITDTARERLVAVSDDILVRPNTGFDIWAHKEALAHLGDLSGTDEIILANDTWFGPVRPMAPLLARMDQRPVHFWGMTDHAEQIPNPFTGKGRLPYHLQSFWIAVRREMFLDDAWRTYWRDLPVMDAYNDAVLLHEAQFTERFTERGFIAEAAFPCANYPSDHPALFNADLLIDDGCPLLKRRPFFHYPPFLDRHAVIGREIAEQIERYGYPMPAFWQNLARNVPPRTLNADAAMLEVLPERERGGTTLSQGPIAVLVNIVRASMAEELFRRISFLPDPVDVFITVPDDALADEVRAALTRWTEERFARAEVRVISTRKGRHMSAFLIGCRDVLTSGRYRLVVKLHTKKSSSKAYNVSRFFARHQLENLLSSPGYTRNLLALFEKEPGLGVVFPPTMHIGIPMLGSGWARYRPRVESLLAQLGVRVPIDEVSPLAPLGGMFVARPEALTHLIEHPWTYADYNDDPRYPGAPLAASQERMIASVAGENGYHCRTVLNPEHAAISHTAIEFGLDQLSSTTPGYPIDQIQFLHRAGWWSHGGTVPFVMMYLRMNHPRLTRGLDPLYRGARTAVLAAKGAVAAVTGKGARR